MKVKNILFMILHLHLCHLYQSYFNVFIVIFIFTINHFNVFIVIFIFTIIIITVITTMVIIFIIAATFSGGSVTQTVRTTSTKQEFHTYHTGGIIQDGDQPVMNGTRHEVVQKYNYSSRNG